MLAKDTEIFLKKKRQIYVNMLANNILSICLQIIQKSF